MTTLDRTIAANERIATNTTSVVAGEVDNVGGKQIVFTFRNDWGASVVCHRGSYGGRDGLWELAVLDIDGNLRYDSGVTGDVLGYLTPAEVVETLEKIVALPQMTRRVESDHNGTKVLDY